MCHCTPAIRTPFCGKPGCEWPKQKTESAPEKPAGGWRDEPFPGELQLLREAKNAGDALVEKVLSVGLRHMTRDDWRPILESLVRANAAVDEATAAEFKRRADAMPETREWPILRFLIFFGAAKDANEARRLIAQGAVRVEGQQVIGELATVAPGDRVTIGSSQAYRLPLR